MFIKLLVATLAFLFLFRFELLNSIDSINITTYGITTFRFFGFIILLIVGFHYISLNKKFCNKTFTIKLWYLFLSMISLCFVTLYDMKVILTDSALLFLLFSISIIFFIYGDQYSNFFLRIFPLKDVDRRLFLNKQINKRSDLISIDIYMLIIILMPIISKWFW